MESPRARHSWKDHCFIHCGVTRQAHVVSHHPESRRGEMLQEKYRGRLCEFRSGREVHCLEKKSRKTMGDLELNKA